MLISVQTQLISVQTQWKPNKMNLHPNETANLKKLLLIAADNGLCSLGVQLIMFGYKHNIQPENQQQPKSYWTDENSTSFVQVSSDYI